jgi:mannose-6-phosphate isomerase-like protein (cupin superfamily)
MQTRTSVDEVLDRARTAGVRYSEFLRVPALSAGVYALPAGATDRQTPHSEDEIYYVVRGRARFRHGPEDDPVEPGDVLFVPAKEAHHFHSITEDLVLLVAFGPAESKSPG